MFYGRYNTRWILTQIHVFPIIVSSMEITKLCHGLSIGKSVVLYSEKWHCGSKRTINKEIKRSEINEDTMPKHVIANLY